MGEEDSLGPVGVLQPADEEGNVGTFECAFPLDADLTTLAAREKHLLELSVDCIRRGEDIGWRRDGYRLEMHPALDVMSAAERDDIGWSVLTSIFQCSLRENGSAVDCELRRRAKISWTVSRSINWGGGVSPQLLAAVLD